MVYSSKGLLCVIKISQDFINGKSKMLQTCEKGEDKINVE